MSPSLETLKERARPWTEPISADSPAGKVAKFDPAYEAMQKEVSKLESASGGTVSSVDWKLIVDRGGEILQKLSKDLLVASYLSYGLYATQGAEGLATGMVVLTELMDRYWPSLFPEATRLRARANALTWLVDRVNAALPAAKLSASDRPKVEALAGATGRLLEVTRAKFENNAPALNSLSEAVERLRQSIPAEAPPAAPAPSAPTGAPSGVPQPAGDLGSFLREVGTALAAAAGTARRADPTDAAAYRALRTGLWLHINQLPPAGAGGKTSIPPPTSVRAQLDKMAANGKWSEVLEESESALVQHRFNLDLQRYACQALAALGPTFRAARDGIVAELTCFLRRLPALPQLLAADGSPLADSETRAWIESEVQAGPPEGKSRPGAGAADGSAEAADEARGLVTEGKVDAAISLLQEKVHQARDGKDRFRLRLALAKLCAAAGQKPLALGLFDALDHESIERGLDAWEPALAAECLEGLLACAKAAGGRGANGLALDLGTRYHRLCKLDPQAALRVAL